MASSVARAAPPAPGSVMDDDAEGGGKTKSPLVLAAERIDRRTALLAGYLRKKNSADKWQKRWFEIVQAPATPGQAAPPPFWVYYKSSAAGQPLLCAMDLWRASEPGLEPPEPGEAEPCCFHITWDRFRVFRASTPHEALCWVNAIKQVQATRPSVTPLSEADRARALAGPPTPALSGLSRAGGAMGVEATGASKGAAAGAGPSPGTQEWSDKDRKRAKKGGADTRTGEGAGKGKGGEEGGVCGSCVIN